MKQPNMQDPVARDNRKNWPKFVAVLIAALFAGGALLCVLLFLFPTLRGQGYLYIEQLFSGDLSGIANNSPLLSQLPSETLILVIVFIAVLLLKVVVSVLTVDSGGDGGIFAPSMFIGAFTGFGFARIVNLTGVIELQECNFAAVCDEYFVEHGLVPPPVIR